MLGSGDPQLTAPGAAAIRMSNVNTRLGSHCIRNVLTKNVAVLRMFNDTMLRFCAGLLYVGATRHPRR